MSDDEVQHSEEEASEEEEEASKMPPPESSGPSEAELAMQRRRQAQMSTGLDEDAQELLEANRIEREKMEAEIQELRERSIQRKKERAEEEQLLAEKRAEEDARRREEEEERKRKKEEEENKRKEARAAKMAEFEKWKNPTGPNFVITKREGGIAEAEAEGGEQGEKKSREQLEAEKKAILAQRIPALDTSGMDQAKLAEKAKELHTHIYRLESEKYDLEKRFKEQQYDMMELAERARQINKVGKGGLKRVALGPDDNVDKIQERFAGAPAKVQMYSKFERQQDKREYGERYQVFTGPSFIFPAEKIKPCRIVKWNEGTGLPEYEEIEGAEQPAE